ncbi:Stealth-like protein [Mariniflexile fucanivorans]|uniref:Stealth-like protein n=1 Tax=Mariniflexile fucanivorans TaxID=264023 RepID=A0A4R1RJ58_9FLAO|nr:Stealth CR1 domain-containing protein [Mariniflexile fucanivorans]TCL66163.1 Stealth-like protein [Mariniflexile fucanivorans]
MKEKNHNIQLDAVIPWVNGNDKKWQEKINQHLAVKIDFSKKKESVRFNSIGEINIAIKSIIKYAPFFKNIYLVTDEQIPDAFESLKALGKLSGVNLEIIDHKILFRDYEEFLPCFNSTSIISLLHRIPNLSEHYVLFNDDFFILKNATVEDFFIDGLPVLRGVWEKYYEDLKLKAMYYRFFSSEKDKKRREKGTLRKSMQIGAKLANDGRNRFLKRLHTPVSMRKSILIDFFSDKNELLKDNIAYKFRDNNHQFITETLANHLEIKNNTFHYKPQTKLTYFRSYKSFFMVKLKLFLYDINKNMLFITFQSLEMADSKTQEYILNWLDKKIR